MEMKEVVDREGRDAKNIMMYQYTYINDIIPNPQAGKVSPVCCDDRKPPMAPPKLAVGLKKQTSDVHGAGRLAVKQNAGLRVRSASTGRDKKSELQARYWALLFGNLQRAVNEIYQTVECYENMSSCQEAILVLENYVRDFKSLSEWFKVAWDYESKPQQLRPQSLTWEVRKSNPLPRVRAKSLSSPTMSGKSSPCACYCNSGKSSPCCSGETLSPNKKNSGRCTLRVNVRDLFQPRADVSKEPVDEQQQPDMNFEGMQHQYSQTDMEDDHLTLADLRERERERQREADQCKEIESNGKHHAGSLCAFPPIEQTDQKSPDTTYNAEFTGPVVVQTNISAVIMKTCTKFSIKTHKLEENTVPVAAVEPNPVVALPVELIIVEPKDVEPNDVEQNDVEPNAIEAKNVELKAVDLTEAKLDAMENAVLAKDALKPPTLPTTELKKSEFKVPSIPNKINSVTPTTTNSPLKYSSVLNRPPTARSSNVTTSRSSAAAKPMASNNKTMAANGTLRRSATTVNTNKTANMRPPNSRPPATRAVAGAVAQKLETFGPPLNVATRLSARSRTMLDMEKSAADKPNPNLRQRIGTMQRPQQQTMSARKNISRKSSREDIGSSSSTLKASNERISSNTSSRGSLVATTGERRSEPKQMPSDGSNAANDGWLTVKNRRRSSMHWSNRFNQPTGYASLPTLALMNGKRQQEEEQQKQHQQPKQNIKHADAPQNKITTRNNKNNKINANTKINLNNATKTNKENVTISKQGGTRATTTTTTTIATTLEKQEVENNNGNNNQKIDKTDKTLRPEIKLTAKAKVNSLPVQRKSSNNAPKQPPSVLNKAKTQDNAVPNRQTIIKRQRSDLTGLKITSLHKEYKRSEKNAQRRLNGQQQQQQIPNKHSTDLSSTENDLDVKEKEVLLNCDDGDLTEMESSGEGAKIDIKIQTNNDFSKTIGDLYESIAKSKVNGDTIKTTTDTKNLLLLSCDEESDEVGTLPDLECDEDQRMLVEEQESLERQIRELESTEIDVDTETDETDCEVVLETEHEDDDDELHQALEDASSTIEFVPVHEDANLSLELRYQALLSEMSWGEREQVLATLQAYVSRHPGRAQELHQKLSSPSRRRSLQETLKKYQAKQARAQQKRELLQKERALKIQQLLARVEDVKAAKKQLIEDKRLKMEGRLQRAAENREQHLRHIIEKAHDEEKKLKEINFIKNIEAQNKRLELMESCKDAEGRLQDLEQERQKRLEDKAAKEAAVERRRQELEKERQRKLEKMNETRLEKEQRIGKMQEQKEQQRLALAREKARDREERLLALQVQQQQSTEELQRKILQKQKESARRHEENIEHIRQRALELTIPTRNVDENVPGQRSGEDIKNNSINYNNNNNNNSSIDDGDLSSTVSDMAAGREHSRAFKKKLKKLKQRLAASAEEYLKEIPPLPVHIRRDSRIPKYLNLVSKGGGAQGMERALGHMLLIVSKAQFQDFQCFLQMDGLNTICTHVIVKGMQDDASDVSKKAVVMATQLYRNVCTLCPQIARHAIMGNTVSTLFEILLQAMQLPDELSPQHPVELSTELMLACTVTLAPSVTKKYTHPKMAERLPDLISYAVLIGLIDVLSRRCMKIRESIENYPRVMLSLLTTIGFITRFVDNCPAGFMENTRLLNAAKSTELFGTISMLYASVVPTGECIPPRTVSLAAAVFNLIVAFAALDMAAFQDVLSHEQLLQKYFDVVLILLKYCDVSNKTTNNGKTEKTTDAHAVIIDVVASLGFLCANNKKYQDLLVSDQYAIIIKSLAKLPAVFDSIVYPCLVTVELQNQNARNVIGRDFNLEFLDEYKNSVAAKKNHLISLLKDENIK